jgi:hypothetical protein
LAAGSLWRGRRLEHRVRCIDPEDIDAHLHSARMRGRILAFVVALAFVVWLVVYAQGGPWTF